MDETFFAQPEQPDSAPSTFSLQDEIYGPSADVVTASAVSARADVVPTPTSNAPADVVPASASGAPKDVVPAQTINTSAEVVPSPTGNAAAGVVPAPASGVPTEVVPKHTTSPDADVPPSLSSASLADVVPKPANSDRVLPAPTSLSAGLKVGSAEAGLVSNAPSEEELPNQRATKRVSDHIDGNESGPRDEDAHPSIGTVVGNLLGESTKPEIKTTTPRGTKPADLNRDTTSDPAAIGSVLETTVSRGVKSAAGAKDRSVETADNHLPSLSIDGLNPERKAPGKQTTDGTSPTILPSIEVGPNESKRAGSTNAVPDLKPQTIDVKPASLLPPVSLADNSPPDEPKLAPTLAASFHDLAIKPILRKVEGELPPAKPAATVSDAGVPPVYKLPEIMAVTRHVADSSNDTSPAPVTNAGLGLSVSSLLGASSAVPKDAPGTKTSEAHKLFKAVEPVDPSPSTVIGTATAIGSLIDNSLIVRKSVADPTPVVSLKPVTISDNEKVPSPDRTPEPPTISLLHNAFSAIRHQTTTTSDGGSPNPATDKLPTGTKTDAGTIKPLSNVVLEKSVGGILGGMIDSSSSPKPLVELPTVKPGPLLKTGSVIDGGTVPVAAPIKLTEMIANVVERRPTAVGHTAELPKVAPARVSELTNVTGFTSDLNRPAGLTPDFRSSGSLIADGLRINKVPAIEPARVGSETSPTANVARLTEVVAGTEPVRITANSRVADVFRGTETLGRVETVRRLVGMDAPISKMGADSLKNVFVKTGNASGFRADSAIVNLQQGRFKTEVNINVFLDSKAVSIASAKPIELTLVSSAASSRVNLGASSFGGGVENAAHVIGHATKFSVSTDGTKAQPVRVDGTTPCETASLGQRVGFNFSGATGARNEFVAGSGRGEPNISGLKADGFTISGRTDAIVIAGRLEGTTISSRGELGGIRDFGFITAGQSNGPIAKAFTIEVGAGAKGDATAGVVTTTGGVNIANAGSQSGHSGKGDVQIGSGRTDAVPPGPPRSDSQSTSPRPDGIKFDTGFGGRSNLTPQMVAGIAQAIKFGAPLPAGLSFQNGEVSFTYGSEVLFFPGLKAALKFAEVVGLIENDSDDTADAADVDSKANASVDTRVRYCVKEGETVESIAAVQLGDARFADLIIIINRAEILHRLVGNEKVPFVYGGQVIWLPSDPELNVYRKNFFSKNAGGLKPAAPRLSGEVFSKEITKRSDSATTSTGEIETESGKALHQEYIATRALKIPNPRTTVRDLRGLQPVRNNRVIVGAISRLKDAKIADNATSAGCVDFDGETVVSKPQSDALMVLTPSAVMIDSLLIHASVDGGSDVSSKLVSSNQNNADATKNSAIDDDAPTVFVAEQASEAERLLDVRLLARDARIIVSDLASNPLKSYVKLELLIAGQWCLVSTYDCTEHATARIRTGRNGVKSTMMLHLPSAVVRTMALEDFGRNWATYRANFIANRVKNSQIDSVPQTPIEFKRVALKV